jgi:hypothetical protein
MRTLTNSFQRISDATSHIALLALVAGRISLATGLPTRRGNELSWCFATTVGPFETTRMLTILLNEWLPAMVDGTPQAQVIADLLPPGARWWAAFGPLPIIAAIWAFEAWRRDGFTHVRGFLAGEDATAN